MNLTDVEPKVLAGLTTNAITNITKMSKKLNIFSLFNL